MAFRKDKGLGVVSWISPQDDAIDTDLGEDGEPKSSLEKYRETWDFEKHCVLREGVEPTIFKLNFNLTYMKRKVVENATIGGFAKGEETGYKLGNHSFATVAAILVDIVNPEALEPDSKIIFKRGKDSMVSEETMDDLSRGKSTIIGDIFAFYMAKKNPDDTNKKK